MKQLLLLLGAVCVMSSSSGLAQFDARAVAALDRYVSDACVDWQVPGLAMVVVHKDEVVYQTALGERKLDGLPVDDQTIFCIGSTTKAMTAMAMAMLVDEGVVDWNDRVIDHLPEFRLHDPYVTREVRVRDLFTHNLGLGNADVLWAVLELPASEILSRIQLLEPAYTLRGGYTYQNIMYAAAGKLIERLSGLRWSTFVGERIFAPLGMEHTYPTRASSLHVDNRSTPHFRHDGVIKAIDDLDADEIAPAGAVWSCTEDMAKWIRFLLNGGVVNETRLVSAANFAEIFNPQIVIPRQQFYPTQRLTRPHWTTYGLGWFQHDYHGRFVSFHTGSLPGTIAIAGLIPDEELGVCILANLDHAEVRHALMYKVFDIAAGELNGRDWSAEFRDLYQGLLAQRDSRRAERMAQRIEGTTPGFDLAAYTGTYSNDYLGKVVVVLEQGVLLLELGPHRLPLEHWHHDTFRGKLAVWSDDLFLTFIPDAEGNISMTLFDRKLTKVRD
ncbi:MAG: serine hydrolase [Saprospiraceae bacterium]|nr:serine hydrolase [Saprospiraceae bacterium]